ncbi:MAG TPA: helix-turn-helix domain-containing protein [Kutzneria sp.]|nr:helix-turn-helix domain-containing protein [Kutzneria sp.]
MLRRFRLRARLTQEELAERSGLSVRTIRGLESGRQRNPQLGSLRQLAGAMGLDANDRDELVATTLSARPEPAEAEAVLPRQLPAAPAWFTGRHRELDGLVAAMQPSAAATIAAVSGAGGIGKTWLVLRWAHQFRDRFPDGQLFVDLRGFSPNSEPLDPLTAVRGFLHGLGVDPARMAGRIDEDSALYRSTVAGKRMLIVLDNAAGVDQVVPLLPGTPACTVLVTSRMILTPLLHRYGAHHLSLSVFTEDDAYTLLTLRLGDQRLAAEPEAVAELVALCGRYPLALAIMTARALAFPDIPLAELTAELRESRLDALDDDDPTASQPAVMSWSLRALTDEQRIAFGLLGIAPGADIGLPAAASLTGLPPRRTRSVLRKLEEASLLCRKPGDRYAMHDIIRCYAVHTASTTLAEEERESALRRMVDFHGHAAHVADRV